MPWYKKKAKSHPAGLPGESDINVCDSPDERSAVKNFLGKSVEDILLRIPGEYQSLQEDLAFMGPRAFAYYAEAWERFLELRLRDEDVLRWTLCILDIRCLWLDEETPEARAAMLRLLQLCISGYQLLLHTEEEAEIRLKHCEELQQQLQS